MKVLITGDRGFIAQKVKERLITLGHTVVGYDIIDGNDLLDRASIENAVRDVEVVYHLAAQADLTKIKDVEDGRVCVDINIDGTHNVAYACAKYNKWLIYASTCCVYGNVLEHPEYEDTTLPNPSELYACTKYAGEWIVRGYASNYGMPWTILRFATVYGEGMRQALGVSVFLRQAMSGQPITVHGDGTQDRTLTFIDDLVSGIVAPLSRPQDAQGQVFNITTAESVSALKMANDIKTLTGSLSEIIFVPQRNNQTFHEAIDVSKAKRLLGWEAETSWEDGLRKTYEWMLSQG